MRFFRRGRSAAIFLPILANPAAPKLVTEINAIGVDLSAAVTAIAGFTTSMTRISEPVMKYPTESQTTGPQTYDDTTMTLFEDDGTGTDADALACQAARLALAEGAAGFLLLHPTKAVGFTASDKVEVWPVAVGANNRSWSLDTESARYTVAFAITGNPFKSAAIAS